MKIILDDEGKKIISSICHTALLGSGLNAFDDVSSLLNNVENYVPVPEKEPVPVEEMEQ